jgi:hypothetical protein
VENRKMLTGCLIQNGTVSAPRDMIRALETIEGLTYRQVFDGAVLSEGRATLVKIMAEPGAATMIVNGCLFLNVLSFEYLTFETDLDGRVVFELFADGMRLVLEPVEEEDESAESPNPRAARIIEAESFDPDVYAMLDDDDEDEAR